MTTLCSFRMLRTSVSTASVHGWKWEEGRVVKLYCMILISGLLLNTDCAGIAGN